MTHADIYDPMADLRTRHSGWLVDLDSTGGPPFSINRATRRIMVDLEKFGDDPEGIIAYVVALLDYCPMWPPSRACRERAGEMARRRLGRSRPDSAAC